MNFGMITLNQSIKKRQNYATWILAALLFILKQKISMKTLLMMLKTSLMHLTTMKMIKDRFQLVKTKKIGLFMDELGGKFMDQEQKHLHT